MTVLVTGGCGLVGIHAAKRFATAGHQVICYDKNAIGHRIAAIVGDCQDRIEFVAGDIGDTDRLASIVKGRSVAAIVHAAALINETICRQHPLDVMRVNVAGTASLLEVARTHGVRRLIYTSSATVYGSRHDRRPIVEDETAPGHIYGYSKFLAEQWIEAYRKVYGVDCDIVRLSSVYGPGKAWAPDRYPKQQLCVQAIRGRRYTMEDGGDYSRDFTYVGDVAEAIYRLYTTQIRHNHVFNVATGRLFSLRDVAETLNELFPRASLTVAPGQFADSVSLQGSVRGPLSIERAKREFGYAPAVSLHDGLREYTAFIARHYLEPGSNADQQGEQNTK